MMDDDGMRLRGPNDPESAHANGEMLTNSLELLKVK